MNELEHYDPYFEIRQAEAKAAKEAIGEFVKDEATDPLNYLGLGAGKALKWAGKGMFGALMAGKAEDAQSMMFGGRYLNKELIAALEKALQGGESAQKIFKETGYFQDPRGQWRKYVPDKTASGYADPKIAETVGRFKQMQEPRAFLKHIFESPALKEDPNLGNLQVGKTKSDSYHGLYSPDTNEIELSQKLGYDDFRQVAGHETNHAVQEQGRVGLAERGANPNMYKSIVEEKTNKAYDIWKNNYERVVNRIKELSDNSSAASFKEMLDFVKKQNASYLDMPRGINKKEAEELMSLNRQFSDIAVFSDKFKDSSRNLKEKFYRSNPGEVEAYVTGKNVDRDFLQEGLDELMKAYDKEIGNNTPWYLNHDELLNDLLKK